MPVDTGRRLDVNVVCLSSRDWHRDQDGRTKADAEDAERRFAPTQKDAEASARRSGTASQRARIFGGPASVGYEYERPEVVSQFQTALVRGHVDGGEGLLRPSATPAPAGALRRLRLLLLSLPGRDARLARDPRRRFVRERGADDVAAEHRQEDERAGKDPEPRLGAHRRLRLVQHVAPARRRRLHPDAEEAQRALEQNRRVRRRASSRLRPSAARQAAHVAATTRGDVAPTARAAVTKSFVLIDCTSARTTRAVSIQPAAPTSTISSGTLGARIAAAIMSSGRRGTESIASVMRMSSASTHRPAHPAVAPTVTPIADAHGRGHEPDRERDARAEQHAREEVAPQLVGAEPVTRRWRGATIREVERIERVRRDERRERRQQHERDEHAARDGCLTRHRAVALTSPLVPRARVERVHGDVGDEAEHHDGDRRAHEERHEHGVVALRERLGEQAADARPREHALGHDRA